MTSTDTGCSGSASFNSTTSSTKSLNYSHSDINAISVSVDADLATTTTDVDHSEDILSYASGLKYLPTWPAVNLEFTNLTYAVPVLGRGTKQILRSINGEFRSHEITAIMGPSGAGKTTLLNLLAGFGARKTSGQINVNHNPRDMRVFRKMSRYIMQTDVLDPQFTVREAMLLASHLKLGNSLSFMRKLEVIDEILCMLRLKKSENTKAHVLSGGEKKRLCIAMELVNNPPVLFLDEPTTGLDDLSSSQCIALLRRIAHSGRTIICSIHTPSAKLFDMFDKVYVLAEGQCVYQGSGGHIVPYMEQLGLSCPLTYNPADFIIEVACREYGNDFHDRMVDAIENGKVYRWTPVTAQNEYNRIKFPTSTKSDTTSGASSYDEMEQFDEEINPKLLRSKSSWWMQYKLLLARMLVQMWRDKSYIRLKFYMNIILALIVGGIYKGVGNDATKALYNFGFTFTIIIAYLYLPMMPVLLQFPSEMKLLKREYFNQWYHLSSYYSALICSKLPFMFVLAVIYLSMVYLMSSQPPELFRFAMLFLIAFMTAMTSDSLGLLISSRLSLVNAMFCGPVLAVPLILLSCYGIGQGNISPFMYFIMSFSYLRHGMEGLVVSLYGYNRADTFCPQGEIFCMFRKSEFLLQILGFKELNYFYSLSCLFGFYVFFTVAAYAMIKYRLKLSGSTNVLVQNVAQFMSRYFNFTSYHY